jgi:hypothetical protein
MQLFGVIDLLPEIGARIQQDEFAVLGADRDRRLRARFQSRYALTQIGRVATVTIPLREASPGSSA